MLMIQKKQNKRQLQGYKMHNMSIVNFVCLAYS